MAEIEAVAGATAGEHRGDIEGPEPRRGLPGVEDPAPGAGDGLHVRPRRRRDAAGALEQVQHRALGPEDAVEGAAHHPDHRAGRNHAAVRRPPFDPALAGVRDGVGERRARHHATAAILDPALGLDPGRHGEAGGDVGLAVLGERDGGDALRVRPHRPSATIRSIAPRARAAMSGGTVTWCWSSFSESRTPVMVIAFM